MTDASLVAGVAAAREVRRVAPERPRSIDHAVAAVRDLDVHPECVTAGS
ncbi:hypothetical protein ACTWPW_51170 [Nonomuraea sp. KM90]